MKNDCRKIEGLLVDFADKKLDQQNTGMVKAHLKTCKSCSRQLDEILQLFEVMKSVKAEKAPAEMRENFMHMLEKEKQQLSGKNKGTRKVTHKRKETLRYNLSRIAAAVAILITGLGVGFLIYNQQDNGEINELRSELNQVKQDMILMKLQEESASQRIYAAGYFETSSAPVGTEVIEALKQTALTDDNTNVRLAAIYALNKSAGMDVQDFFVELLKEEDNPLVQIPLINMLVEMDGKAAVEPLQNILYDNQSMDAVKLEAKKGLERLV